MRRCLLQQAVLRTVGLVLFTCAAAVSAYGQDYKVRNSASYIGSGRYEWAVCIRAEPSVLASIDYVEYTLHPTFPDPVRRGEGRHFTLRTAGWGEFKIAVKVVFANGDVAELEHWLDLDEKSDTCPRKVKRR